MRFRGHRGGLIRPHRAFWRLRLSWRDVVTSFLLASAGTCAWLMALPLVGRLWVATFRFWAEYLGWHDQVFLVPKQLGLFHYFLPFLNVPSGPVDSWTWITTALACTAATAAASLMSEESVPWKYLLRAVIIIQVTALIYFKFGSARFPHDLGGYTGSMLDFSRILIALVPWIYAFTYYVFPFSLFQKVSLTLLTMAHMLLFVPMQYLAHAYLIHTSVLFMPVVYFAFGPFLDVLVLIAFYSWGMSWRTRNDALFDGAAE